MPNRVTHDEVEALVQRDDNAERVTAVSAEVIIQADNNAERVSQIALEVVVLRVIRGSFTVVVWD